MVYLVLGVLTVSWFMFIYFIMKERRLDGFYLKGFTSFIFVFLYAYGVYHTLMNATTNLNESMIVLIIGLGLGLVLGLIGDLFLEVQYFYQDKKIKQIKYGMIVFGFSHLFYLAAITEQVAFHYASLLIGLVMTLVTFLGAKTLKLDFGKLKLFSYAYSFVIFTMVGQSIFQAIGLNGNTYSVIFMVGAILFGISDLLLAPIYFRKDTPRFFVIANLGTYYIGQALIALSVYFLI